MKMDGSICCLCANVVKQHPVARMQARAWLIDAKKDAGEWVFTWLVKTKSGGTILQPLQIALDRLENFRPERAPADIQRKLRGTMPQLLGDRQKIIDAMAVMGLKNPGLDLAPKDIKKRTPGQPRFIPGDIVYCYQVLGHTGHKPGPRGKRHHYQVKCTECGAVRELDQDTLMRQRKRCESCRQPGQGNPRPRRGKDVGKDGFMSDNDARSLARSLGW